jgi:hypothetical protein
MQGLQAWSPPKPNYRNNSDIGPQPGARVESRVRDSRSRMHSHSGQRANRRGESKDHSEPHRQADRAEDRAEREVGQQQGETLTPRRP